MISCKFWAFDYYSYFRRTFWRTFTPLFHRLPIFQSLVFSALFFSAHLCPIVSRMDDAARVYVSKAIVVVAWNTTATTATAVTTVTTATTATTVTTHTAHPTWPDAWNSIDNRCTLYLPTEGSIVYLRIYIVNKLCIRFTTERAELLTTYLKWIDFKANIC